MSDPNTATTEVHDDDLLSAVATAIDEEVSRQYTEAIEFLDYCNIASVALHAVQKWKDTVSDESTLSERQRTIRDAEGWLYPRCPNIPQEELHKAAVRIANIVLGLHLHEAVDRQYRGAPI